MRNFITKFTHIFVIYVPHGVYVVRVTHSKISYKPTHAHQNNNNSGFMYVIILKGQPEYYENMYTVYKFTHILVSEIGLLYYTNLLYKNNNIQYNIRKKKKFRSMYLYIFIYKSELHSSAGYSQAM